MNFHVSSGEDYYSQDNKSEVRLDLILSAINSFDWDNSDIKDERVKRKLAEAIKRELSHTS